MWQAIFIGVLAIFSAGAIAADGLTADEARWLRGIEPVLAYARATQHPIRVIVQPQATPGLTPLGMAFVDGRCTLVLSMRGNPMVQALLQRIAPDLLDVTLELMAAHELGHCERHLRGVFGRSPAGFDAPGKDGEPAQDGEDPVLVRSEEAYADLVGLAWIRQRHAPLYGRLHAWLLADRSSEAVRDSDHDTSAWLRLVADGRLLDDPSIFTRAERIWARALPAD